MHQELLELVLVHFQVLLRVLQVLLLVVAEWRFTNKALRALFDFFHFNVLLTLFHGLLILDLVLMKIPFARLRPWNASLFGPRLQITIRSVILVIKELLHLCQLPSNVDLSVRKVLTDDGRDEFVAI